MKAIEVSFRPMEASDWKRVAEIYKQGIDTGNATFQLDVPSWEDWDKGHIRTCRIVAEADNEGCGQEVVGWAALSPVSDRCVYSGVAEVSVYVSNIHTGHQIGRKLLEKIVTESEKVGFWTLQASVFPENVASRIIQEKLGFRQVGFRERIGKMNDEWRDTILLERRSLVVGV